MGRPPKNIPKQQLPVKYAFQRELLGDLIFDTEKDRYHNSRYLLRNIKRVLRYHKRNLLKATASKLNALRRRNGSSFLQNNRPSLSFGEGSSHASFSDARKTVVAKQDDDREFPAFSEYIKDRNITLYVPPFKPKEELCLGQSELHLNIVRLRAKSGSNGGFSRGHYGEQFSRCIVSVLLLNRDSPRLDPIAAGSMDCGLMITFPTGNFKVFLNQPFKLGGEISTGSRYHMEVRLTPAAGCTAQWPPVPVTTSRTSSSLIREPGSRTFRDGLYASYKDFPLPHRTRERARLLYAADGVAYKTKYDLEISVAWVAAPPQTLGKISPGRFKPKVPEVAGVITSYTIASAQDQRFPPEARRIKFTGYHCPLCLRPLPQVEFEDAVALRFHFATAHPAHKVVLQKTKPSARRKDTTIYSFLVSAAAQKEKFAARCMTWVAPSTPFDVIAYLDGDESWLGSKSISGSKGPITLVENRVEALRRENNGFLPVQHIQDIPVRPRRKYPVTITKTRTPLPLFTSITHRVLQPDEELSESDDDTDQTWLRDRHAQEIMDVTSEPLELRKLQVRWNDHVKSEQISSAFYCNDVFFRWVKKDKEWLGSNEERLDWYHRFSARLWEEGKISRGVVTKCRAMICLKRATEKAQTMAVMEVNGT